MTKTEIQKQQKKSAHPGSKLYKLRHRKVRDYCVKLIRQHGPLTTTQLLELSKTTEVGRQRRWNPTVNVLAQCLLRDKRFIKVGIEKVVYRLQSTGSVLAWGIDEEQVEMYAEWFKEHHSYPDSGSLTYGRNQDE